MPANEPRVCRNDGCDVRVFLARRDVSSSWLAVDATAVPAGAGDLVLVDGTAWRPLDLIDHFQTRFETDETSARALAADYPWHRAHRCAAATEPKD